MNMGLFHELSVCSLLFGFRVAAVVVVVLFVVIERVGCTMYSFNLDEAVASALGSTSHPIRISPGDKC